MQDINEYLISLADELDMMGKKEAADAVDKIIQTASLQKLAQYVGAIGYVLRQNRALGNCIRKKRVASKQPMQEVVLECLSEYQDGNSYNDTEWAEKYASSLRVKPELFDTAHISLLAQISETNNMPTHVANVKALCATLAKFAVKHDEIKQVLDDFQAMGNLIKRDVGEPSLPFKVAAPPSPRSWWSRLWNPSESAWRDTSRGQQADVGVELSSLLEHLSEMTRVAANARLKISDLKRLLLNSMQTKSVNPATRQLIENLDPDNWQNIYSSLQQLEKNIGQLPYDAAKQLQNMDSVISGVYRRLEQIQNLMTSIRQRPAAQRGHVEIESLDSVLKKLYSNPLNEEYLYYANRMYHLLSAKIQPELYQQEDQQEGMREWYMALRNTKDDEHPKGWAHHEIVSEIARQMDKSTAEIEQILARYGINAAMNMGGGNAVPPPPPTSSRTTTLPLNQSPGQDTGTIPIEAPAYETPQVAPPAPQEPEEIGADDQKELDPDKKQRIFNLVHKYLLRDPDLAAGNSQKERAENLQRLLGSIFTEINPNNKIWEEINKQLDAAKQEIPQQGQPSTPETPPLSPSQPTPEEPEESEEPKEGNFRTGSDSEYVQIFKDAIAEMAKTKGETPPDMQKIEKPDDFKAYLKNIPDEEFGELYDAVGELGEQLKIDGAEDLLFDLRENWFANSEFGKFTQELPPPLKQQNSLQSIIKIADELDKIDRNAADIIDQYLEEHLNDEWPSFPQYSSLLTEKG